MIRTLRDQRASFSLRSDGAVEIGSAKFETLLIIRGNGLDVAVDGTLAGVLTQIGIITTLNTGGSVVQATIDFEGLSTFLLSELPESVAGSSGPVTYENYRAFFDKLGSDGAETKGTKKADVVFAGGAADTIKTLGGNDKIVALTVSEIEGGKGRDLVDLTKMAFGVVAQLDTGLLLDRAGSEGRLKGIENLKGTKLDDTLTGNNKKNNLDGGRGDDTLNGKGGRDSLKGGKGQDMLNGDGGNDTLKGQGGADVLNGGAGKNTLTGGKGNDTFIFTGAATEDVVMDYNRQRDELIFQGLTENDIVGITVSGNDSIVELAPDGQDLGVIIFRDDFVAISDFVFN
ncbi:MAG: calcium-binding protein [Arenibacterium sp.]